MAPECKNIDPDVEGGEEGVYNLGYPIKVGLMNNPTIICEANLGVANSGRMNNPSPIEASMTNLSPNLVDAPQNIPPAVYKFTEQDSL